jgi:hypothetical protein
MAASIGEELKLRKAPVGGRVVAVVSYRQGDKYLCRVDNIDPVTVIARGEGRSRAQAEQAALIVARRRLTRNKHVHDTLTELHTRVASLDKRLSEPPPPFNKA